MLAWFSVGCSESSPKPTDGGASNDATSTSDVSSTPDASSTSDVSTSDGNVTDTTPTDASQVDDHPTEATTTVDADAGCECSISDAGLPVTGVLSMPCYCVKQDWHDDFGQRPNCPTYDDAIACPDAARSFYIATYKNCNFVTVNYDVFNAVDTRVYDATTHELVGAMRGTDFVVAGCGARSVNVIQSGVVPGPECEMDQWVRPCDKRDAGDVTMDGAASDGATSDVGACACTLNDADPPEGTCAATGERASFSLASRLSILAARAPSTWSDAPISATRRSTTDATSSAVRDRCLRRGNSGDFD